MTQDLVLYKMRDALERINIHYCKSDDLTKTERKLFEESKKALDEAEMLIGRKTIVDGIDISILGGWKKHIYYKFERMCSDYGCSPKVIRSKSRDSSLVDVRQKIAKSLYSDGFDKQKIGWAMNRDRSTVYNLIEIRKAA